MSFEFRVLGFELIGDTTRSFTACKIMPECVCRLTGSKQSLTGYCNDTRSGFVGMRVGKPSDSLL